MISFSSGSAYVKTTLRLFGENLDPERINSILGISATTSFRKGDIFSQGKNTRKSGMWALELSGEGRSFTSDLLSYVDAIPDNLLPISNIDDVTSGKLSLWINETPDSSAFEITIDPSDIELINRLGVQLDIAYFRDIRIRNYGNYGPSLLISALRFRPKPLQRKRSSDLTRDCLAPRRTTRYWG